MEWQNLSGSTSDSAIFSDTNLGLFTSGSCAEIHLEPQPYLEILVQPQSKFRFRYKSEMTGKHGSLLGNCSQSEITPSSSNCPSPNGSKIYPTVKLHNFSGEAVIRCSLVCELPPHYPHPHVLHTFEMSGNTSYEQYYPSSSSGYVEKSYAEVNVSAENEHTAVFQGMNIIYTGKKGIKKELIHKYSQLQLEDLRRIHPDKLEELSMGINLNVVLLYFEAFVRKQDSSLQAIVCPLASTPIQHNKSTQTSDLRIVRIDKYAGCCTGDEEVFLLVEKVDKHNIQVRFFQENEKGIEVWKAYGKFSKLDVHHQYAIVFKTPPYRSLDIDTEEEVFLQLERPSDGATSQPIPFKYKPIERIRKMPKRQKSRSGGDSQGPSSRFQPQSDRDLDPGHPRISEEGEGNDGNLGADSSNIGSVRQGSNQIFPCDLRGMSLSDNRYNSKTLALNVALSVGESLHEWAQTSDFNLVLQKLRHLLCLVDENGDNAFHTAILFQQRKPFRRILNTVVSSTDVASIINETNLQGLTPLSVAVLASEEEFVKELLQSNADMSICNFDGDSPVHLAVKSNSMTCLKALVEFHKATEVINRYNYQCMTPLHLAVSDNNLEAIMLLLSAKSNLDIQEGTYGRSPLHIAVEKDCFTSTFLLLKSEGGNNVVNMQNYRGDTPLHCAASSNLTKICALLLYFGADPTIENYCKDEDEDSGDVPENSGQSVFEVAGTNEITTILNGNTELWELAIKPIISSLEVYTEKDTPKENIPLDSGIDIKEPIS